MTPKRIQRKRRKPKWRSMRFRKHDPAHNLIAATQAWIRANGGSALVLGGIGIMDLGEYKYAVCIKAMGKKPEKKLNPGDTHG